MRGRRWPHSGGVGPGCCGDRAGLGGCVAAGLERPPTYPLPLGSCGPGPAHVPSASPPPCDLLLWPLPAPHNHLHSGGAPPCSQELSSSSVSWQPFQNTPKGVCVCMHACRACSCLCVFVCACVFMCMCVCMCVCPIKHIGITVCGRM